MAEEKISVGDKCMYTFRGLLAFIAFMDLGLAIRSFIEKRTFLGEFSNAATNKFDQLNDPTLTRILGTFALLKAITLIHCTLYIYNKPVVSIGICSSALTIFMYLLEATVYHSTTLNFHVIFPCILNGATIIGLIVLPSKLPSEFDDCYSDENEQLARRMNILFKNEKIFNDRRNKFE